MLDGVPSRTAMATAFIRALHVHIDEKPAVFEDREAYELLPVYLQRFIDRLASLPHSRIRRYRQRRNAFTMMRAQVVVRSRYAEDVLVEARKSGAGRFVILAAGLDTFALRQRHPLIDVVEIDHPATQLWKRQLLHERRISEPAELTFRAVNFEEESLADQWIDSDRPDCISWLGTTYYLTRAAIEDTLRTLAERTRSGSQLVFDYWHEPPPTDLFAPMLWGTRIAVALQQETMRSFFAPDDITAVAEAAGWRVRENCDSAVQNRRYLASRGDRLLVPSFAHLLRLEH